MLLKWFETDEGLYKVELHSVRSDESIASAVEVSMADKQKLWHSRLDMSLWTQFIKQSRWYRLLAYAAMRMLENVISVFKQSLRVSTV